MSTHDSTINRDSQAYWNKRATTFTRFATGEYERWLMDLLALTEGEEVLDMGCATGTLAVPLARAGHRVHGCDFAEAMLAILDERAAAEHLPITSHLLASTAGAPMRTYRSSSKSASNWTPSRRPLARSAPCCFI